MMNTRTTTLAGLALAATFALGACAQTGGMKGDDAMADSGMKTQSVMVGGAKMLPRRNIVENAVNSADHETLVAAVKQAGLVKTLSGKGPFTVFAPTDAAFDRLPQGTVDTLMMRENRTVLRNVLTYHVVPGTVSAKDLMERIREGGGAVTLETASGGTLTARMNGPMNVVIEDERGDTAQISTYDVMQSNGVIHVVDSVLHPAG